MINKNNRCYRSGKFQTLIVLLITVKIIAGSPAAYANQTIFAINQKKDTILDEGLLFQDGVIFYHDNVVIVSSSERHQKMIPGHISFGTKRTYLLDPENIESTGTPFIKGIPFAHNPSGMSVSAREQILYFTVQNEKSPGKTNIYAVNILEENIPAKKPVKISDPVLLPFCNDRYNDQHPAISSKGDFLIFSSDRSGGTGGYDLYLVNNNGAKWGKPFSLGKNLNTPDDELYPFLDHKNNLYFSSGGYSGYGKLDLFICKFNGDGWDQPVNLMEKCNSGGNDIAIRVNDKGTIAFYLSQDNTNSTTKLFRVEADKGKDISNELYSFALAEYENIYGSEFALSIERRIPFPYEPEDGKYLSTGSDSPAEVKQATGKDQKSNIIDQPLPSEDPIVMAESGGQPSAPEEKPVALDKTVDPDRKLNQVDVSKTGTDLKQSEPTIRNVVVKTENTHQVNIEEEKNDRVIFRVQITSTRNPTNKKSIEIDGSSYPVFEYLYKGAYRQTVGGYHDLEQAKSLQKICRNSGYNQAFVAAFKNNERVTDPSVFR